MRKIPKNPSEKILRELLDLYQKQKFKELNRKSHQILKTFKKSYVVWNMLGISLQAQGKVAEASTVFKKVVELNPRFPDALNNLGYALNSIKEYNSAVNYLKQAIKLKPDFYVALNNLGNAFKGAKRFEQAIKNYDLAISYKPNYAEAIYNKGLTLRDLGEFDLALTTLQRSIHFNNQFAEAFNSIGSIYNDKQNKEKALEYFQKAIGADPKNVSSYLNLCEVYEKTNELEKFASVLSSAIANKAPASTDLLFYKGLLAFRLKKYAECISLLDEIDSKQLSGLREASYWRIKANSYQSLEEYNAAFGAFISMNEFVKKSEQFDKESAELFFKKVKAKAFELNSLSKLDQSKQSKTSTLPFKLCFLIGFPRSGTTLLDTILRSHSRLRVVEEKPMINLVDSFLEHPTTLEIENLNYKAINKARDVYLDELEKHVADKKFDVVIDKLPLNIIQLPIINRLFPDARYLFAIRHPLDAVLSCWMQNFRLNPAMGNFLDLTRTVDLYCKTMEIADLSVKRYDLKTSKIHYEDLVGNMHCEIMRLLEFLGLPWEENIKNYQKTAKQRSSINTPSYWQVIEPLYKSASYRWKNYESHLTSEIHKVEPWIKKFGYSL